MKYKRFGFTAPGSRTRLILGSVLAVLVLLVLVAGHVQAILDYARLYHYTPDSQVTALADQTTMTAKARHLFYVNHPQIDSRNSFNAACNNAGEQTIVLGCYHPVDRGIYLFGVTDIRLNGVEQVTAAHEMLHAAYDRLSSKERQTIDRELRDFYNTQVHDQRIRDTMAAYQKSEPNDVANEMHSIFGTEIASLTPELEDYYRQYFTNRSAVIRFADNYQQEFTSRQTQVAAYDKQLADLKTTINGNTATLKKWETEINAQERQMETDRSAGNYDAYNAAVPAYNARVDQYNALVSTTQNDIAEYNRLVAARNSVALQVRELTQSISSQPAPISQ